MDEVARFAAARMAAMAQPEPTPADDLPAFTPLEQVRPRTWSGPSGRGS